VVLVWITEEKKSQI